MLFVPAQRNNELFAVAEGIRDTERRQAERIRAGVPLREQVGFGAYLARRAQNPALTFREHLRTVGGAIEEVTGQPTAVGEGGALPPCGASGPSSAGRSPPGRPPTAAPIPAGSRTPRAAGWSAVRPSRISTDVGVDQARVLDAAGLGDLDQVAAQRT